MWLLSNAGTRLTVVHVNAFGWFSTTGLQTENLNQCTYRVNNCHRLKKGFTSSFLYTHWVSMKVQGESRTAFVVFSIHCEHYYSFFFSFHWRLVVSLIFKQDNSKSCELILTKLDGSVGRGPGKNTFKLDVYPDSGADSGIFTIDSVTLRDGACCDVIVNVVVILKSLWKTNQAFVSHRLSRGAVWSMSVSSGLK